MGTSTTPEPTLAETPEEEAGRELAVAKAARPFDLTLRQLRFAMAYLQFGNAERAAKELGFKDPKQAGNRLIRQPNIIAFIKQELAQQFERARMDVPEILGRLAWLARGDKRKLMNADGSYKPFVELDEETAYCIRGWKDTLSFDKDGAPPEMTRDVKFADPLPPLRTLAQVAQLLAPEQHTTNVFLDMAGRLDAAAKRHKKAKSEAEDATIVSEQ